MEGVVLPKDAEDKIMHISLSIGDVGVCQSETCVTGEHAITAWAD